MPQYHYIIFDPEQGYYAYNWPGFHAGDSMYMFTNRVNFPDIIFWNRKDDAQHHLDNYIDPQFRSRCKVQKVIIHPQFEVVKEDQL